MRKMILTLEENQMNALATLAKREFRNPWQVAVRIINNELEKQGLITITNPPAEENAEPVRAVDDSNV